MQNERFEDRIAAGRALAAELEAYKGLEDVVVHALPRAGVPVGFEVAKHLGVPLDVTVVRKLGAPGHEEVAMGAITSGGVLVRNESVIRSVGIDDTTLERIADREHEEALSRERRFRGDREIPSVEGKTVIVVDDGIATGSTIRAAVRALRRRRPARIVVAIPVAPPGVDRELRELADEVHCLRTPSPFIAVGAWYEDFRQTTDDEVRELLDRAAGAPPDPSPPPAAIGELGLGRAPQRDRR